MPNHGCAVCQTHPPHNKGSLSVLPLHDALNTTTSLLSASCPTVRLILPMRLLHLPDAQLAPHFRARLPPWTSQALPCGPSFRAIPPQVINYCRPATVVFLRLFIPSHRIWPHFGQVSMRRPKLHSSWLVPSSDGLAWRAKLRTIDLSWTSGSIELAGLFGVSINSSRELAHILKPFPGLPGVTYSVPPHRVSPLVASGVTAVPGPIAFLPEWQLQPAENNKNSDMTLLVTRRLGCIHPASRRSVPAPGFAVRAAATDLLPANEQKKKRSKTNFRYASRVVWAWQKEREKTYLTGGFSLATTTTRPLHRISSSIKAKEHDERDANNLALLASYCASLYQILHVHKTRPLSASESPPEPCCSTKTSARLPATFTTHPRHANSSAFCASGHSDVF